MKGLYLWPESLLELSVPFVGILHVSSVLSKEQRALVLDTVLF